MIGQSNPAPPPSTRHTSPPDWLFDLGATPPPRSNPPLIADSQGNTGLPVTSLRMPVSDPPGTLDAQDKLEQTCKELEGLLLGILLRNLGKQTGRSGLFSQTWESSFYQNMFYWELAQDIGANGPGLGIAEVLHRDIMLKADTTV